MSFLHLSSEFVKTRYKNFTVFFSSLMASSEAHKTPDIARKKCEFKIELLMATRGKNIQNCLEKMKTEKKKIANMQNPTPMQNIIEGESVLLMRSVASKSFK